MDHQRPAGVNRPRVLITHRYFWPEDLSLYPLMLKDIAEWHVRQGHDVTVFTASASTHTKQTQRRLWAANCGVQLQEVALPIDRGRSILPRLWAVATYASRLWRVVRSEDANLIIAGTTPPIVPGLVTRLAKRRDAKFLYYVQDIAPEMLSASTNRLSRYFGKLLSKLDRRTVDTADATITISEEMRSTLLQRLKAVGDVRSVSNYVIDATVGRKPSLRRERPRLLFAGNQGKLQNLAHVLRAVAIASQTEAFDIDIVGAGSEHHRLRTLASELGLGNVTFHGQVARDAAQELIAASDIGVVAAAPGLYRVAYPSKINSYLIGGLPTLVFADSDSPIDRWLMDNEFGMTACPTDPERAAQSIVRLVSQVRAGHYSADRITQRASELLSAQAYFNDYQAIVDPLLQAA